MVPTSGKRTTSSRGRRLGVDGGGQRLVVDDRRAPRRRPRRTGPRPRRRPRGSPTKRTTSVASRGRRMPSGSIGRVWAMRGSSATSAAENTPSTPGDARASSSVDGGDPGVGVGRPDVGHPGRAVERQVLDVGRRPGQEPGVLDPLHAVAEDAHRPSGEAVRVTTRSTGRPPGRRPRPPPSRRRGRPTSRRRARPGGSPRCRAAAWWPTAWVGAGTLGHGVAQPADAGHLDLDHVTELHRAGVGRGAGEDDVARQQRDVAAEVGEDVVDREGHLGERALLHDLAVDVGAQRRLPDVHARHEAGADRAVAVLALDPEHRAGVGLAEVVEADVVGRGEPGQVVPHVVRADVAHGPADDGGDLALVVDELAVGRAVQHAPVAS